MRCYIVCILHTGLPCVFLYETSDNKVQVEPTSVHFIYLQATVAMMRLKFDSWRDRINRVQIYFAT